MDYPMEELLPIVTELSKKYTSFESSSVTYETAQMLMEAILYSISQCVKGNGGYELAGGTNLRAKQAYEKGYEKILQKTIDAKHIYEQIIDDFQGYGCRNYEETILRGMPSFFLYYDARFQPQNHILTLDYPVIGRYEVLQGVDRICNYLAGVQMEQLFLDQFDVGRIQALLDRVMPDGRKDFMDNICELVLLCVVGCVICDRPIESLELDAVDSVAIRSFFADDSIDNAEQKISGIIRMIMKGIMAYTDNKSIAYFQQLSREFAVRIRQSEFML